MLPAIEKDLIGEILYDQDYDWKFLSGNMRLERPTDEVFLVVTLDLYYLTHCRLSIIETGNEYYLISQAAIIQIEADQLDFFKRQYTHKLEYEATDMLTAIDFDYLFYNIEWFTPVTKEFVECLIDNLNQPNVGYPYKKPKDEILYLGISVRNNSYLKWTSDDPTFTSFTNLSNYLLNYSLQNIHTAYSIKPCSQLSKQI
jgi:hypothetical protein